jgi:hypothetical protein
MQVRLLDVAYQSKIKSKNSIIDVYVDEIVLVNVVYMDVFDEILICFEQLK